MIDGTLSAAFRTIRDYTAARAWAAEILAVFVLFTAGRFGLAVWLFDAALVSAGAAPGGVPAAAAGAAGDAGAWPWWVAWLYAYDNLRAYAESAIIVGVGFAFVLEGGIMFLARKRIRLSKEEGREEGRVAGREEVRAEVQPQLDAAVATAAQATAEMQVLREENRLLRERQTLRDEEIRQLLERQAARDEETRQLLAKLAQRANGDSSSA